MDRFDLSINDVKDKNIVRLISIGLELLRIVGLAHETD